MQKKYLEPWMRVQIFDEEMLTDTELGDDSNRGTFDQTGGNSGEGNGDGAFDGLW